MARKKNVDIVPEVDAIKAGIDLTDRYSDLRDENGYIVVSRNKESKATREEIYKEQLAAEESRLNKLREKLTNIHGDKIETDDVVVDDDELYKLKEEIVKLKKKKKKGTISDKEKKRLKKLKGLVEKNTPSYDDLVVNAVPPDLSSFILNSRKGKKKKKDGLFNRKDSEEYDDQLHGLKKKDKNKKASSEPSEKKEKDEVDEAFKEIDKLSKENIKEIDSTMKVVDEQIKNIVKSGSRIRGRDTAMANYINAKASLISSRQSTINNMASVNVKKYDIKMKKAKTSSEAGSAASHAEMIARIFPTLANDRGINSQVMESIAGSGKNKNSEKKKKKNKFRGDASSLMKREKELIDAGDIEYNVYDRNIELEGKYDIAIKKSWTTGEWKFVALDKQGDFIDIPKKMLPKKSLVSLSFDDEKDIARDNNTQAIYKVFSMPTI